MSMYVNCTHLYIDDDDDDDNNIINNFKNELSGNVWKRWRAVRKQHNVNWSLILQILGRMADTKGCCAQSTLKWYNEAKLNCPLGPS